MATAIAAGCGGPDGRPDNDAGPTFNDAGPTGAVRTLPGLQMINFYERTGGSSPQKYSFAVDGPELAAKLPDPLRMASRDIEGASEEYYDVYYSNAQGEPDLDGAYLTISGKYIRTAPSGGGLNLAEIELVFADHSEYGNVVASYAALGDNKDESRVNDCVDGKLETHTSMGNTVGTTDRLRLTLGFPSTAQ
ncbi:MAG: hypothetical protein AB7P03_14445 [Kofleriaceae bacterium]